LRNQFKEHEYQENLQGLIHWYKQNLGAIKNLQRVLNKNQSMKVPYHINSDFSKDLVMETQKDFDKYQDIYFPSMSDSSGMPELEIKNLLFSDMSNMNSKNNSNMLVPLGLKNKSGMGLSSIFEGKPFHPQAQQPNITHQKKNVDSSVRQLSTIKELDSGVRSRVTNDAPPPIVKPKETITFTMVQEIQCPTPSNLRSSGFVSIDTKYLKYHKIVDGPTGDVYYGNVKDGKKNEFGTLWNSNGQKLYDGYWLDGSRHGKGTSYNLDGSKSYRGDWAGGLFDNVGASYWQGSEVKSYEGVWAHGVRHGSGVENDQAGKPVKGGNWKNGTLV
jgi:hypothetical protein